MLYSQSKAPKVAIFGLFGSGNLGNDAKLEAMLHGMRRAAPHADFYAIAENPETVTERFDVPAIDLYQRSVKAEGALIRSMPGPAKSVAREANRWERARQTLKDTNHVLLAGAGVFNGRQVNDIDMPFRVMRWTVMTRARGGDVHLVAMGGGDSKSPWARRALGVAGRAAVYRSWRNYQSRDFAEELGISTAHDSVVPDLIFALPTANAAAASAPSANQVKTVGLGVMAFQNWKAAGGVGLQASYGVYLKKVVAVARWLLEDGKTVRLLVGDDEDEAVVEDVKSALAADVPDKMDGISVRRFDSIHDIFDEISKTDAVIASRFHNVVAALRLGKPVVSLGYGSKFESVLEEFSIPHLAQNIWEFDVDKLKQQFAEATKDPVTFRNNCLRTSDRLSGQLEEHFDRIARRFEYAH